ncbi:MAG TPA: MBL fold metallo-hydrolase [Bryobacteraceae bacterium]|nr:MBL fold metallo-hydrolase [Bryobacteraceae bacterium]
MRSPVFFILAALAASSLPAQDAAATIKAAEYALGMIRGPRRVDAINTLEYWGAGYTYAFGQAYHPGAPWPAFKVTYHASISYALPAMRVDITRSNPEGPVQGGGGLPLAAPQRQIQVVSGDFAWNESVPGAGFIAGSTATPAPGAAADRLLQLWVTPFGVLKMAERAGTSAQLSTEAGLSIITFPLGGQTVKLSLNSKQQVERVETHSTNPVLGDTLAETTYSDYKDLGEITSDVLFPSHIVQKQGGFPVLDLTITKTDPNNPYVVFPVPDNVERAPKTPVPVKVDARNVAPGVWYLTGGTHHSVAVEFKNYVALVECPLDDERARAVLDTVKRTIPKKPIRYVVNTHHHFDHLGGLRACAADGATILTQAANKPYYETLWPSTRKIIEPIAEKRVIADGTQSLELYHLQGSNHADTMLIGYVPKAKVLIEADVYTPAAADAPHGPVVKENVNLNDNLKRLGLDVQQITPLHGRAVTISDLRQAIGAN